jgi:hypothetical protein
MAAELAVGKHSFQGITEETTITTSEVGVLWGNQKEAKTCNCESSSGQLQFVIGKGQHQHGQEGQPA